MDAAIPSVFRMAVLSCPYRYPAPAAAPNTPVMLLACQPRRCSSAAHIRPILHSTSVARINAFSTSSPEEARSSPTARTLGNTATVGWPRLDDDVSSSSSSWPLMPLRKAALLALTVPFSPTSVQHPGALYTGSSCLTTSVQLPASIAPMVSTMERLAR